MPTTPTIDEILADPASSVWLQMALTMALRRDCVDAANDAAVLAEVLQARADKILRSASQSLETVDALFARGKTD
jgi:hypothetical protein